MTTIEFMLFMIFFMLVVIFMYVRWIYLRLEYPGENMNPVNVYGETWPEAIQNGIARGHQGISTYD